MTDNPAPRWVLWMLIALTVLGCAVRFVGIQDRSLWADELFTVNVALNHPLVPAPGQPWYRPISMMQIADGDTFFSVKAGEQSPPLFDLLEKASLHLFGPSEFAARLPSALAACVLLLWIAVNAARARDPWLRRLLVWALLLLALHPGLIAYAKEARAYSLGASLIGMALVLWVRRWHGGLADWVPPSWGEISLLLLACYSHYNAAAMVALLLAPDAVVATWRRCGVAWTRLLTLGAVFSIWVAINARTVLFTASGGVAWPQRDLPEYLADLRSDVLNMLHLPWLISVALLAAGLLIGHWRRTTNVQPPAALRLCLALLALTGVYVALAAGIAFKAGMGHARFYIFVVPVLVFSLALVCAELRSRSVAWGFALLIGVLSLAPPMPGPPLRGEEDFRGLAAAAAEGSDEHTLFLYPWKPNYFLYRFYLDRYLGRSSGTQLVAFSGPEDVKQVCARLQSAPRVVALAHVSQSAMIDMVYAACGTHWPRREKRSFTATLLEHWRIL